MKSKIVILFLIGILVSGCINNPFKQVPIVRVNITLAEKGGHVVAINQSFTPDFVDYGARPRSPVVKSFPAIVSRVVLVPKIDEKNSTIGQWETLGYNGNGTYSFKVGFLDGYYPQHNDTVFVTIMINGAKGERIGFVAKNIIWDR
jgi:hypothetical protein